MIQIDRARYFLDIFELYTSSFLQEDTNNVLYFVVDGAFDWFVARQASFQGHLSAIREPKMGQQGALRPAKTPFQGPLGIIRTPKMPFQGQLGTIRPSKTLLQA